MRVPVGVQRGIGELMLEEEEDTVDGETGSRPRVLSFITFLRKMREEKEDDDNYFGIFFEAIERDLDSMALVSTPKRAFARLVKLQNQLVSLIRLLDPDKAVVARELERLDLAEYDQEAAMASRDDAASSMPIETERGRFKWPWEIEEEEEEAEAAATEAAAAEPVVEPVVEDGLEAAPPPPPALPDDAAATAAAAAPAKKA